MSTTNKAKARTQTFSSGGLYGSSSTGKNGTTYNPSDFEKQIVDMTKNYIPQYLNQLANPTYDSPVFKAQTAQRNRLAKQSFENNLINPLASRGLTRGSSLNQMSNQFANKLADMEVDAMANEDKRTAQTLNNLFNVYQVPYNNMIGMADLTNNAYQQAVQNAMKQNEMNYNQLNDYASYFGGAGLTGNTSQNRSWQQNLGGMAGAGLGAYFGGPVGMQVGGSLGSMFGGMWR